MDKGDSIMRRANNPGPEGKLCVTCDIRFKNDPLQDDGYCPIMRDLVEDGFWCWDWKPKFTVIQVALRRKGCDIISETSAQMMLEGCKIARFLEIVDEGVFNIEVHSCIWQLLEAQGSIEMNLEGNNGTVTMIAETP